jgi:Ser/Thr protein kinase RdoA (MazF antagonist)
VISAQADDRVVVKLTDERLVEPEQFERRLDALVELAQANGDAVGPQRHRGAFMNRLCGWLVVVYPFIDGTQPDLDRERDVARMGRTLAGLHRSMAALPTPGLRVVAALRVASPATTELHSDRSQLIHGDFAPANLCIAAGRLRVFDFDDCGSGPVEFDVGNALYMVLFDATIDEAPARYHRFRPWFVDAYRAEAEEPIDDDVLDTVIELRRSALRHWLDNLGEAPIGIRTSSPQWRRTLRSFTDPT